MSRWQSVQDAVAEEFEALVVRATQGLAMRAVRQSAIELLGPSEMMAEDRFQFRALLFCHSREHDVLRSASSELAACFLASADHLLATILQAAGDLRALLE